MEQPPRIKDIPSIRQTLEQARGMASFKAAMPLLRPLLKLLRVDTAQMDEALRDVENLAKQLDELSTIPDTFNDLFADRGWIIYDRMDLSVAKRAIERARDADFDGAEKELVEYYNVDEVRRQLRMLNAVKAFRHRMRLAEKALDDYAHERFHACIPLVLALMDGLVSELSATRRGFFAEEADLSAWDSIAAHDRGLTALARIMQKGRRKMTTQPITLPYRHGIMHGMDLGYDNALVAAKTWAAMFAVRDWAVRAERGQLAPPPPSSTPGLLETLQQWKTIQDAKAQLAAWTPRHIDVGASVPSTGQPETYEEGTAERQLAHFLTLWQRKNFGHMADVAGSAWKGAGKPSPAEVRAAFEYRRLVQWELSTITDQAAAVCVIRIKRLMEVNGPSTEDVAEYRLIRIDENGDPAIANVNSARWTIANWSV